MQPAYFEGSVEVAKPADVSDEECFSVWAKIDEVPVPEKPGYVYRYHTTYWMPSYEDLKALNAGRGIMIQTQSNELSMMAVYTLDENGNCNDAG